MALPLVWLADVLRGAGLSVVETPGWRDRSASGTQPRPEGVLEHHTATPTSYENPAPTVGLCIRGRADLPGPLCHAVIGYDGVVHVIAAGRANHAGRAQSSGPVPSGDGNTLYVGFEWDYQGVEQGPSPQQRDAATRATAAVLGHLRRPAEAARGHKETSVTGKIDPGHVDMDQFRREVAAAMRGDDMTPDESRMLREVHHELFGPRGPQGEIVGWGTEAGNHTVVGLMVQMVNGLLGPRPSQVPGSEVSLSAVQAIRNIDAVVHSLPGLVSAAGGADPQEIADALRPAMVGELRDVVRQVIGEGQESTADEIVDRFAQRLSSPPELAGKE